MAGLPKTWFIDGLARNIRIPQKGLYGWLILKMLERNNAHQERNVVRLSNIKPDHSLLEIGFGPGFGLESAYNIVKNGTGRVYGIDPSFYMHEKAKKRVKKGVQDNKVILFQGSVDNIPLNTDSVQRVIHCNSFYYWPNLRSAFREIYRVMQPGGLMVTAFENKLFRRNQGLGLLKYAPSDPVKYMRCLEKYGFQNVHLEHHRDSDTGTHFQAIFSGIGKKPAHDKHVDSDNEDSDNEDEELDKKFQEMLKWTDWSTGPRND